ESSGSPSPLDLCHEGVSERCRTKSWGTITYGQNLDLKELRRLSPGRGPNWNRIGITVRASTMIAQASLWTARSEVTRGCGKRDFRRVGILRLRKCCTSFRTCLAQDDRTWGR